MKKKPNQRRTSASADGLKSIGTHDPNQHHQTPSTKVPIKNKFLDRLLPVSPDSGESKIWRKALGLLLLATLILLPLLSLDVGISADESRYVDQANKVFNYYASGGKDKSAVTQAGYDPQYVNSQSFDLAMKVLEKIFHPEDPYRMRHIFNALTGWLMLLFTALFVARIGGYRAACLALFLLLISPFMLGHSYNNNKDIPITAAFTAASYFMMAFFRDFPHRKFRNTFWIVMAIAVGISVRVGSIILIPYFFLFAGFYYLIGTPLRELFKPESLRKAAVLLGIGFVILPCSYFLGILPWPFGLEGPISNTLTVLKTMSSLGVSLTQVFEGETIWSNQIPWFYTIKYMSITIPVVVFVGVFLFIILLPRILKRINALPLFILAFSWLFPIGYAALYLKNDYGSWRHFIFTYPYMIALAALGFDALIRRLPKQSFKYVAGVAILLLCYHPVSHIIRNHPHEYVYYNEIIGGVDKANGYYETDYYQESIRAACEWLENHLADELAHGRKFIVGKNDGQVEYYLRHLKGQVEVVYTEGYYNRGQFDWDYGIFYAGYLSPYQLRNHLWPPAGTIHAIKVDNTAVCAIVKRPSKEDFQGYEALKRNDLDSAIAHFQNYLAIDNNNDEIQGALASAYLAKGEIDQATNHALEALRLNPDSITALDIAGRANLQLKQYDTAIQDFTELAKKAPSYNLPFYFLAVCYLEKNNPDAAIQMGNQAIMRDPGFAPAYQLVGTAFQQKGDQPNAQAYFEQAQKIQSTTGH